jgi:diguanylate cyclase (GGDEF)-like protein/PAS domain S-box-containing protein
MDDRVARAVFELAINAIMLASDDGCYVDVNEAACHLTGYSREELLTMSVPQLVVPDSLDLDTVWSNFLEAGSSRGRVQLRRKDGRVIVVSFNAKAQVLPGLNLSILTDVTEEVNTQQRLEDLARSDPLTGIGNRRHFMSVAAEELARARRHGQPLALLMIDLDHFKSINDCHGHVGGDEVLRSFAQSVGREIRQGEHFARIGGEEFAVLLPQTGLEGAATFAQRLLMKVRAQPADLAGVPVPFTASIGVAALAAGPADEAGAEAAATIDKLMQRADRALYRCKAGGRDRFEVCQDAS